MKLTHLEHVEDNLMEHPEQVLQTLNEISSGDATISLKWDGSPAIIFGTDPFENKFFLSTKSLFNKVPKVNYSCDDIMLNHGDNYVLACKLMYAFTLLKANYTDSCIVQADLLFCKSELSVDELNGVTFKPNTLTYSVHNDTTIEDALLGLVIHTKYLFTDYRSVSLQDMSAFPYTYTGTMGDKIWIGSTKVLANEYHLDVSEAVMHTERLIEDRDPIFVQAKILDTGVYADYKIFYNSCIRDADYRTGWSKWDVHWKCFIDWSIDRAATQIKKLKTPAAMKNHLYDLDARMVLLHDPKLLVHFQQMIIARDYINGFKTHSIRSLQFAGNVRAMFDGKICAHEGYVVTSTNGTMMKIVNRREFSARNFNNVR